MTVNQDAGRGREWFGLGQDPRVVQEWLRQNNLMYGGLVAVAVHSAGYVRLERDQLPTPPDAEEPGDPQA
jgi:hypothetical protein